MRICTPGSARPESQWPTLSPASDQSRISSHELSQVSVATLARALMRVEAEALLDRPFYNWRVASGG